MYTGCVINNINKIEDRDKNQKKRISTGIIMVLLFLHNRSNQSDPHLAWIMFHNISNMYFNLKQEEQDSPFIPLAIADGKEDITVKDSRHNRCEITIDESRHSVQDLIQVPNDLLQIQP